LPTKLVEVIDGTDLSRSEFVRLAVKEKIMNLQNTAAVHARVVSPGLVDIQLAAPNAADPYWDAGLRTHVRDQLTTAPGVSRAGFTLMGTQPTIRLRFPTSWSDDELKRRLEGRAGIAKVKLYT